jgi:murein DD-endopeptidase MepM/ murein hydrolase activator NlpD
MLTNYQVGKIAYYSKIAAVALVAVFVVGTLVRPFTKDRVIVSKSSYILKEGFPLFTSQKEYISLLKHYPYDAGVKINYHTMRSGESYWDLAQNRGISLETLIAANPFLTSLIADAGTEIVIPSENGTLVACDNFFDAYRMKRLMGKDKSAKGDRFQGLFDLLCLDDIRFVFFPHARPAVVNQHLAGLLEIKKSYNLPVAGHFASLYGMRLDPFLHTPDFHAAIDIRAPFGTPIRPTKEGMVIAQGWREGYGLCIEIMHADGYYSIYGHCSKIFVETGMIVSKDDIIGQIGSTGRSTGNHLHFEMKRHGDNVNPLFFIW